MQLEMMARACPVCGSDDVARVFAEARIDLARLDRYAFASRKLPEYMHYRLITCPTCDLLYANPAPTLETVSRAYREAAFDSADEAAYAGQTYSRLLKPLLGRLPDRHCALDIGTGDGVFLEQLLALGFTEVSGVEPSAAPVASAKPAIRQLIRHALFDPHDFMAGSLSLITCFQTIEHVAEPLELCRGAFQLLKTNGAVVIVCHNRRAWSARLLGRRSPIFDIEHLQLFSPGSVRRLLEDAGFTEVDVRPIANRYPLFYWLKLFPLPAGLKRRSLAWSKRAKFGHALITIPAGNMAAVGYKPAP